GAQGRRLRPRQPALPGGLPGLPRRRPAAGHAPGRRQEPELRELRRRHGRARTDHPRRPHPAHLRAGAPRRRRPERLPLHVGSVQEGTGPGGRLMATPDQERPVLPLPAREIPIPTSVSPEAQAAMAMAPLPEPDHPAPDDPDAWRAMIAAQDAAIAGMMAD